MVMLCRFRLNLFVAVLMMTMRKRTSRSILLVALCTRFFSTGVASGFVPAIVTRTAVFTKRRPSTITSSSDQHDTSRSSPAIIRESSKQQQQESKDSVVSCSSGSLPGASEFERWLEDDAAFFVDPSIQHATFGAAALRGLAWNGSQRSSSIEKKRMVATIPAARVLTSQFSNNSKWDQELALQLWRSCFSNTSSSSSTMAGYCRLLTQNLDLIKASDEVPPSTAPHCLRRWTDAQKQVLLRDDKNDAGRALLELAEKQEASWRKKYDEAVSSSSSSDDNESKLVPSWPQFRWAMEAVHSRAYCGVQISGSKNNNNAMQLLPSVLAPVLAAVVGYGYYATTSTQPSELVLGALAVAAAAPTIVSLVKGDGDQTASTAALLPLIDSANHCESANDSRIEYDPIRQQFELWIGPNCLVREEDGQTQLYVRYGNKSDHEWLLNYGFLPGLDALNNNNPPSDDEYRRTLAETFLRHNS